MIKLSKKQVFGGGGLYLGYTAGIVISFQCCFASQYEDIEYKKFVHRISWDAFASLRVNDTEERKWYHSQVYSESIYNVIANAIADCATKDKEFSKEVENGGIVEFDVKPNDLKGGYKPENWNASVLYNFVAEAIYGTLNTGLSNSGSVKENYIEKVGERIANKYKDIAGIGDFIRNAVKDIKAYAEELRLYEYLTTLRNNLSKDPNGFHNNVTIKEHVTENNVGKINIAAARIKGSKNTTDIDVVYKNKGMQAFRINDRGYKNVKLNAEMAVGSEISGKKPIYTYTDKGSNHQEQEYLDSRRHISDAIEILRGSPRMHLLIKKLLTSAEESKYQYNGEVEVESFYIGKIIQDIFENNTNRHQLLKELERRLIIYTTISSYLNEKGKRLIDADRKYNPTDDHSELRKEAEKKVYEATQKDNIIFTLNQILTVLRIEMKAVGYRERNVYDYTVHKLRDDGETYMDLREPYANYFRCNYPSETENIGSQLIRIKQFKNIQKTTKKVNGYNLQPNESIKIEAMPEIIIIEGQTAKEGDKRYKICEDEIQIEDARYKLRVMYNKIPDKDTKGIHDLNVRLADGNWETSRNGKVITDTQGVLPKYDKKVKTEIAIYDLYQKQLPGDGPEDMSVEFTPGKEFE